MRRPLAILLSFILVIGVFVGVAFLVIPELIDAVSIVISELLTKCPQKMCNGNMGRKNDAHWRHFMDHINRFRFKAVAERRQ